MSVHLGQVQRQGRSGGGRGGGGGGVQVVNLNLLFETQDMCMLWYHYMCEHHDLAWLWMKK